MRAPATALAALGLAACSTSSAGEPPGGAAAAAAAFAAPGHFTARLSADGDVDLAWQHRATAPGGYWVELATPGADFVKLGVVWADTPRFLHPQVAADTTFLYRLRPFFGPASRPAAIATGPAEPADAPGPGAEGPLDEPAAAAAGAPARSLRTAATFASAVPADLTVSLSSPTSAELRWDDRAADEDGYLVELAADGVHFEICALLPPDATSFRKISLPPDATIAFRVRPFFYGPPSKLVSVTSAPEDRAPP